MATITTPLNELLNVRHPIMVAGMGGVTMHELVAASSNCGAIGTLGAIGLSPEGLRMEIASLKKILAPGVPWGVDLLLPEVGGNARKTNKDYTGGQLDALVDVLVEEEVPLFVCAVGVPPKWVSDKLHANGTVVMNMVGAPQHVPKALAAGCDIICAQGTEAGGHTGDVATLVLVPQCVDLVKGHTNYFGHQVLVVAAGGVVDGRGVAAAIAMGASGVWCGTRFLMTPEANAPDNYKGAMITARSTDTQRSLIYTGRPMRVFKNEKVKEWEGVRYGEQRKLLAQGVVPMVQEAMRSGSSETFIPKDVPVDTRGEVAKLGSTAMPMGQGVGAVGRIMPAADIVQEMVEEAARVLSHGAMLVAKL